MPTADHAVAGCGLLVPVEVARLCRKFRHASSVVPTLNSSTPPLAEVGLLEDAGMSIGFVLRATDGLVVVADGLTSHAVTNAPVNGDTAKIARAPHELPFVVVA